MTSKDFKDIKGSIEKLVGEADTLIIMSDKGSMYYGTKPDIVHVLGTNINKLCQSGQIKREWLQEVMKAATATDEELNDMIKEELEKLKDKISKKEEKDEK